MQRPYVSPGQARNAVVTRVVTPIRRRRSGKVTQGIFTPRTRTLANAAKRGARRAAAIVDAFPVDKHTHNMMVVKDVATKDMDGPLYEAYQRLLADVELQKEVVTYVSLCFLE